MALFSGIYLHYEGTTSGCNAKQQPRESLFDTDSGLFRYMTNSSGIYYIGAPAPQYWVSATVGSQSGIWYSGVAESLFASIGPNSPAGSNNLFFTQSYNLAKIYTAGTLYISGAVVDIYSGSGSLASFTDNSTVLSNNVYFTDFIGNTTTTKMSSNGTDWLLEHTINGGKINILSPYGLDIETWSGDVNIDTTTGGNVNISASGSTYGVLTLKSRERTNFFTNFSGMIATVKDEEFRFNRILSFGVDDFATAANVSMYMSGIDFYINQSTWGSMFLTAQNRFTLDTWSGDMNLICRYGGDIQLISSGTGNSNIALRADGDITMNASGDIYSVPWTNWSGAVAGIDNSSGNLTINMNYKALGDLVFFNYFVQGASIASEIWITTPYTSLGTVPYSSSAITTVNAATDIGPAWFLSPGTKIAIKYAPSTNFPADGANVTAQGEVWYCRT